MDTEQLLVMNLHGCMASRNSSIGTPSRQRGGILNMASLQLGSAWRVITDNPVGVASPHKFSKWYGFCGGEVAHAPNEAGPQGEV